MNSRAIAISIGVVAAALGVAALTIDGSVLGLLAGLFGIAAGGVALAPADLGTQRSVSDSVSMAAEVSAGEPPANASEEEALASDLNSALAELSNATDRIRLLERELADVKDTSKSAGESASSITDEESQLFSEAYFRVALDARIAAARRHLRPVAIALLEIREGQADTTSPVPPARAAESIRQTIRDADTACRLADGTFAVILEDTPENGAVWTVERIRRNIVSRFGNHTMWAGVACYPAHAFSTEELLAQSRDALTSAREWNQDRIEVAIAE